MAVLDRVFTAEGSPNIALIKYWGKRDEKLILPCNSSISLTLSTDVLRTTTSVVISKRLKRDMLYINGKMQDLKDKDVMERFEIVNKLRGMAGVKYHILIVSVNDFPTASGMASSASGIATLAYVLNEALQLGLSGRELSIIARQGSGSACRSIFGGLVVWRSGKRSDGGDSYAEQIFDERYWPDLIDNIVVVTQSKKKISSRAGMRQTVKNNPLYSSRPASAEKRVSKLIDAYRRKDFNDMAELIMADSNEMHALMLSTVPSIRYLNSESYAIMDAIEELNAREGRNIAAYTFDAGANANIITLGRYRRRVINALGLLKRSKRILYIKTSRVGSGPKIISDRSRSLIDSEKLLPK